MATMNTMSSAAVRPARSGVFGGFVRRIASWARAYAAYSNRRIAIKTLRDLNDHQLRDIGLTRAHIERAVGGLDWPDLTRF